MVGTTSPQRALFAVRVPLPYATFLASIVLIVVPGTAAPGTALLVIAMLVPLAGWLIRLSLQSQHDRDREQRARMQPR
jgi:hypothetical protein